MSKPAERAHSRQAVEALELLGSLVKLARLERKMTAADLAERAGISRPLLRRIERGDPGCSIGAVFEAAVIVGVPLFEAEQGAATLHAGEIRQRLVLMPKSARRSRRPARDDF
ncbi:helix-turn-helix transcriptional regulator [Methylobacterium segetis]|uniref:helix-turn-helix transcriptional regulator n=1 Tax=Methylobacterium segetis TaxID=2488750 RepID=UPI0010489FBA|nr:helix-turn-helix transcriptional regulator [Methylobacterium segetis]